MSDEPISDRLPGIDIADLERQAWGETKLGEPSGIILVRLAVLAERKRVLARLDKAIEDWKRPEKAGQAERELLLNSPTPETTGGIISGWVVAAFQVFRSCLTHAGITKEEAIAKALTRNEADKPITIEAP